MAVDARYRWALLLGALGLTVAAIFYPLEESAVAPVSAASPRAQPATKTLMDKLVSLPAAEPDRAGDGNDPFAPRGWTAPPASPPPVPAAAAVTVAPVDLRPAGPPELPFRYVGSLVDGAEQTVYLARGEQAYVVRAGDVIESSYKVLGINATSIEFEHIPTGARQALTFPARDN